MSTETKQKHRKCRACGRKTLHVAIVKQRNMGCGFWAMHAFLTLITFGFWIPIFLIMFGLSMISNTLSPLGAKYLCQVCGRRN